MSVNVGPPFTQMNYIHFYAIKQIELRAKRQIKKVFKKKKKKLEAKSTCFL